MKSTCHSNIPRQLKNVTWTAWVCGVPLNKFRGKFMDLCDTDLQVQGLVVYLTLFFLVA
jgi:hypothetical protein